MWQEGLIGQEDRPQAKAAVLQGPPTLGFARKQPGTPAGSGFEPLWAPTLFSALLWPKWRLPPGLPPGTRAEESLLRRLQVQPQIRTGGKEIRGAESLPPSRTPCL